MSRERLVVFDLETSGLSEVEHEVVQFAAIAVDDQWRELDSIVARLCGHNASSFDGRFLAAWFKRADQFLPGACFEALDTLALARWASFVSPPGPKDHKLLSICEWLGIDPGQSHRALDDVRATVEVARRLAAAMGPVETASVR